jgi:putative flippase GtrA
VTVILIRPGLGTYLGGALAFACAITVSWYLNRTFTFRARRSDHMVRELFGFVGANLPGAALNYSVYAGLVFLHVEPVAAVATGSIVGMLSNFTLSRWLIFRPNESNGLRLARGSHKNLLGIGRRGRVRFRQRSRELTRAPFAIAPEPFVPSFAALGRCPYYQLPLPTDASLGANIYQEPASHLDQQATVGHI